MRVPLLAVAGGLMLAGCQNGNVSDRTDYASYPYAARDREVSQRAEMIRQSDPSISQGAATGQAQNEYTAAHPPGPTSESIPDPKANGG